MLEIFLVLELDGYELDKMEVAKRNQMNPSNFRTEGTSVMEESIEI